MKIVKAFIAAVAMTFAAANGHAQLYKWVDAEGRIHYTNKAAEAGAVKAQEVTVRMKPVSTGSAVSAETAIAQRRAENEAFKRRQAARDAQNNSGQGGRAPNAYQVGRDKPETNASRCALAQGIVSGQLVHRDGAHTDKNDLEVAARDIRAFCR